MFATLQQDRRNQPISHVRGLGEVVDLEASMARERERREADRVLQSRSIAVRLEEVAGFQSLFLHDRLRGRGLEGEISHVAVAPSGVWVVGATQYDGHRVNVAWAGGADEADRERLLVGGRDKTILVKALDSQRQAVRDALAAYDVPVAGLLCFVGAQLPRVCTPMIHGHVVCDEEVAGAHLSQDGPLDAADRQEIFEILERTFPAA